MRLIVVNEHGEESVRDFSNSMISIGRSAENHLPVADINSSRHHCEIHCTADGHELHDRDSRNGTFLNGRRVSRTLLQPGDAIEIGTTVIYFLQRPGQTVKKGGLETVDLTTNIHVPISRSARSKANRVPEKLAKEPKLHSTASTKTNLFDEIRAHYERTIGELRQMLMLNKTLNSELVLKILLEKVMDTIIDISGAERGFLLLRDGQKATIAVSRNIDKETIKDAKGKISRSITKEVLESGLPVLLSDAAGQSDPRFSGRESILNLQLRSVLSVPLKHRDRILGAIYIDNRFEADCFDDSTVGRLEIFADQAAIAIENARLFEENLKQQDELSVAKEELLRLNELLRDRLQKQDEDLAQARAELAEARPQVTLVGDYRNIITQSPKMIELLAIMDKIADSNVPVLVQGESGTGKELIARALHFNGNRRNRPFVSENCAAIPHDLMEAEFFGFVRGAFTGAVNDKQGLFELADSGTLFLDEVGDMDLDMQTKLLRVLQEGVLRRIGSKEFRKVDVRILSATNRDLLKLIEEGRFREDLYYRLNVINLKLPPLRTRREDIPLLVNHVINRAAKKRNEEPRGIEAKAIEVLRRCDWPGNVRELENEIERALALSGAVISVADLSPRLIKSPSQSGRRSRSLDRLTFESMTLKDLVVRETESIEKEIIGQALSKTGYKKSQCAKLLGISRPTLDAKIEKYKLTRDRILPDG
jgi:transcriptional regulator with GAF, ATPase, and Fis domain